MYSLTLSVHTVRPLLIMTIGRTSMRCIAKSPLMGIAVLLLLLLLLLLLPIFIPDGLLSCHVCPKAAIILVVLSAT